MISGGVPPRGAQGSCPWRGPHWWVSDEMLAAAQGGVKPGWLRGVR